MHAASVADPDIRPKATEEIGAMQELIASLIEGGHAYATDEGDVYFAVRSYDGYGQLSGRNVDEMEGGHRELRADGQGLEDRKRDPLDFALWKAAKSGEPAWDSPWGQGRPGWHIECSAMSRKYLGLPFDLVFPHHENERAQSEAACGCTFANHWMHSGMLQINAEKMSKSLGNFMLLHDVLDETRPAALRMLMTQTHYRSPLDFSVDRLNEADAALTRIENAVKNMDWLAGNAQDGAPDAVDAQALAEAVAQANGAFIDVETDMAEETNYPAEVVALAADLAGYGGASPEEAVEALLEARALARKEKNWCLADGVRDGLAGLGFVIEDTPQGARVTYEG